MTFSVRFSRRARDQLLALDDYIADASSPDVAARFVDRLVAFCSSLAIFPERGSRRDDLRPGIRVIHFHRRTTVAFAVDPDARSVVILAIYQAGRDYESLLRAADFLD